MTLSKKINEAINPTIKVGDTITHKDFGDVKVTAVYDDNKLYNTVLGVSGIKIKSNGNSYDLWFDTETLRKQKRVGDQMKKISKLNGKPLPMMQ